MMTWQMCWETLTQIANILQGSDHAPLENGAEAGIWKLASSLSQELGEEGMASGSAWT